MRIKKIRCYGGDFNTFRSEKTGVLSSLWIQFGNCLNIFLDDFWTFSWTLYRLKLRERIDEKSQAGDNNK